LTDYLKSGDALLAFELDVGETGDQSAAALHKSGASPGLVAAVGWILAKFFPEGIYRQLHESVDEWLKKSVTSRMEALPTGGLAALGKDIDGDWHTLATSFSTYLQWAIATSDCKERTRRVDVLIDLVDDSQDTASDLLSLILLDELVWALLEHALDCGNRARIALETALNKLNRFGRLGSHASALQFSLSWHNGWRDGERSVYEGKSEEDRLAPGEWQHLFSLAEQANANIDAATVFIKDDPTPILVNLQYHWLHFTTQRAVWMREWCFQLNPLAFEATRFSQVAAGSNDESNNDLLLGLAHEVMNCGDAFAVRNLVLMLSTRRHYLSQERFGALLLWIKETCAGSVTSNDSEKVRIGVLQAIFELHRQGFLDEPPVVESDFTTDPNDKTKRSLASIEKCEREFLEWCREWLDDKQRVKHAWDGYRSEVDRVTYITDLHPQEDGHTDLVRFLEQKIADTQQFIRSRKSP
jgi:hypothetical protein